MDLFETMPVKKAYFTMCIPVVLSMVVNLVYNMVDTFFIAQTQNTNLVAGVSLCAPIFTLMIALGDIFGIGGSSIISRLLGNKDYDTSKRLSGKCYALALCSGIVVAIVLTLCKDVVLSFLGVDASTYQYASDYYRYLVLGAPFIIISLTPVNLMRTEGLAKEASIATVTGSIVNMILDPIFILALDMGAAGAAIATVIGNIATDILLIMAIKSKSQHLEIRLLPKSITKDELQAILAIGIPASITNLMQSFSITMMNRQLVVYGVEKVAAMGIALKINMIIMLVMVGFAFGCQPLLGYNYGAKNKKRLREIIAFDIKVIVGFAFVSAITMIVFAKPIIGVFMKEAAVIEAGSMILRCVVLSSPIAGMILIYTTMFQATGKAFQSFVLSISRQGVLFALCITVLNLLFKYQGILFTQFVSDVFTFIIGTLFIKQLFKKENI